MASVALVLRRTMLKHDTERSAPASSMNGTAPDPPDRRAGECPSTTRVGSEPVGQRLDKMVSLIG